MSQTVNMLSTHIATNGIFTSPPIELIQRQADVVEALHSDAQHLYYLPLKFNGSSTGKTPTKGRLLTLHHLLAHHRSALATFLSHEFTAPFPLITQYGELYVKVPENLHFYAQLADSQCPTYLPQSNPRVEDALDEVNATITRPWRLAQKIVVSLTKAQERAKAILMSLKDSAIWTDGVVAIESKRCGDSWCSNLLKDIFARLEELTASYRPIIDYFTSQEIHLRILQEKVFDDSGAQLDAHCVDITAGGLSFPTPPPMPFPWYLVHDHALTSIAEWRAFTPDSEVFACLENARHRFVEDIRVILQFQETEHRGVSDRFRGAISRISLLLHIREIDAY